MTEYAGSGMGCFMLALIGAFLIVACAQCLQSAVPASAKKVPQVVETSRCH